MTEEELLNELKVLDLEIDFAKHGTPEDNAKALKAIQERLRNLNALRNLGSYTDTPRFELKRLVERVLAELFAIGVR